MTDAEFLAAFESCLLPKADWTHAAHLRMAWLYLRARPYAEAVERVRQGILRYNAAHGNGPGYHETVTQAFTRLVFSRRPRRFADFPAFLQANQDLLSREAPALQSYYTPALLDGAAARAGFAAPDLRPLPGLGRVRWADPSDGPRLAEIYRPFVTETAVTFEESAPGGSDMGARVRASREALPWLVCEADGRVAGYAYAARYRERAAYRWAVEVSVYVAPAYHRRGVARALYEPLLECLRRQGLATAFAVIALPNPASAMFHEALGFKPLTIYRKVGYKLGAWWDVGWWELELAPRIESPAAPRPVAEARAALETELLGDCPLA